MREIKFRGKRLDNGWVKGYYYTNMGCKNGIQHLAHFIKTDPVYMTRTAWRYTRGILFIVFHKPTTLIWL